MKKYMKLDFEEFKPLFGHWAELFRPFIESEEMYNIYQVLKKDSEAEGVMPDSENVFRAFQTCAPDTVKCIWYLMDPYSKKYKDGKPQATGIAMDCSNS